MFALDTYTKIGNGFQVKESIAMYTLGIFTKEDSTFTAVLSYKHLHNHLGTHPIPLIDEAADRFHARIRDMRDYGRVVSHIQAPEGELHQQIQAIVMDVYP